MNGAVDRYALGPRRARLARGAHALVRRHERVIADYLKVEGALVPLALPGVRAHICRASKVYTLEVPLYWPSVNRTLRLAV